MNYLDQMALAPSTVLTEAGSEALRPFIQDHLVFQTFRSFGYQTVTFRGFLSLIDLQNVDYYVDFEKDVSFSQRLDTANFQEIYIRTTAFYG